MAKYLVKMTKYKNRISITIPRDLVLRRELDKFRYMIIKASNGKPITLRGLDDEKNFK